MSDDSSSYDEVSENDIASRVGGGKEEIAKAEGVLKKCNSSYSNSSFVDQSLTRRMKDDTLAHQKVLSESNHPITRICITGGPCAGKTTALATLSSVL